MSDIEREMCGKTEWKTRGCEQSRGQLTSGKMGSKSERLLSWQHLSSTAVLGKNDQKKIIIETGKKSEMKKQKSMGEDEFIKNRKWNNRVRETEWGRKWSSDAAMATVPSTQLVEKKAMLRVSRGLSWVQSGDLVWGSDSPVREELSTWRIIIYINLGCTHTRHVFLVPWRVCPH